MQIGATTGELAGRIWKYAIGSTDQADQSALGLDFAASDAGTLRDVFNAVGLLLFLGHFDLLIFRSPSANEGGSETRPYKNIHVNLAED